MKAQKIKVKIKIRDIAKNSDFNKRPFEVVFKMKG